MRQILDEAGGQEHRKKITKVFVAKEVSDSKAEIQEEKEEELLSQLRSRKEGRNAGRKKENLMRQKAGSQGRGVSEANVGADMKAERQLNRNKDSG